MASIHTITKTFLLNDYSLIAERFECPNDPESKQQLGMRVYMKSVMITELH
jgi:hypothetical protein